MVLCRCGRERKAADPRAAGGGGVRVKPTGVDGDATASGIKYLEYSVGWAGGSGFMG